jgi:hypothetical protein
VRTGDHSAIKPAVTKRGQHPLGGVRVVIETEPAGLSEISSGWGAADADALSIDQARRERARRLP